MGIKLTSEQLEQVIADEIEKLTKKFEKEKEALKAKYADYEIKLVKPRKPRTKSGKKAGTPKE